MDQDHSREDQVTSSAEWKTSPAGPGLYYYMGPDNIILPVMVVGVGYQEGNPGTYRVILARAFDNLGNVADLIPETGAIWAHMLPPERPADRPFLEPAR